MATTSRTFSIDAPVAIQNGQLHIYLVVNERNFPFSISLFFVVAHARNSSLACQGHSCAAVWQQQRVLVTFVVNQMRDD